MASNRYEKTLKETICSLVTVSSLHSSRDAQKKWSAEYCERSSELLYIVALMETSPAL